MYTTHAPGLLYRGRVNPRRRRRRRQHRRGLSLWLVPIAILGGIALVGFSVFYLFDHSVTGGNTHPHAPGVTITDRAPTPFPR